MAAERELRHRSKQLAARPAAAPRAEPRSAGRAARRRGRRAPTPRQSSSASRAGLGRIGAARRRAPAGARSTSRLEAVEIELAGLEAGAGSWCRVSRSARRRAPSGARGRRPAATGPPSSGGSSPQSASIRRVARDRPRSAFSSSEGQQARCFGRRRGRSGRRPRRASSGPQRCRNSMPSSHPLTYGPPSQRQADR